MRSLIIPLIVFLNLASAASAQTQDENRKRCGDPAPDVRIGGCTAVIQSGQETNATLAAAFNNRGIAYDDKGDHDRAIQDYDQAIRLNPNYAYAFNNRGKAYGSKGDYDRAIQDYDQAIRLNPNFALSFNNRGLAYGSKGDYDRAIQDYDQAIRLNPNYALAFYNRGNTYYDKKDYDRAIQDYDQAIRLNPNYAYAFYNRGYAYGSKGDYDRAIQDYDQAILLDPNNAGALYNRGVTQYAIGRYTAAQKDLVAALQLQPKALQCALFVYLVQARLGNNSPGALRKSSTGLDRTKWPGKVADLYLGNATPDAVLSAAKDPDPEKEKSQLCQAYFYLAERSLLSANTAEAIHLLQQALQTGARQEAEYFVAKEELRRLSAPPKSNPR